MGRVISRGIDALFKNAVPFFVTSLLLAGLPALAMQWWMLSSTSGVASDLDIFGIGGFWGLMAVTMTVSAISVGLAQGVIVRSTILHFSGRPIDIGQSASVAFALALPIVGLSILETLIVSIGLILLVVPGVILALMFSVAVPALVEEQRGVFASLSRSDELTSGSKPLIFVLMLIYVIFSWIVSFAFGMAAGVGSLTTGSLVLAGVGEAVAATLTTAVFATMVSSLYIELRTMKEGATPDLMAEIFG